MDGAGHTALPSKCQKELRPLSFNEKAAFITFPNRDFPIKLHEERYFGENKAELRKVKQM